MSATPLNDLQFELADVIMGAGTTYPIGRVEGLGAAAPLRGSEYPNPHEDGRSFGREYREGRDLVFEGSVVAAGQQARVWDLLEPLEEAFDGDVVRRTSRAVVPLRLRRPGRPTRVVYGRPDKFDPDTERSVIGLIPWSGTFRCSDRLYYADTENELVMSVVSQESGHIVLSATGGLTTPIRTTAPGTRATTVKNGGDAAAWPVITIDGPVRDPYVTLIGPDGPLWRLAVTGNVAHDQSVVLDTRPWSRGATQNGGPLSGVLTVDSAPSRSTIPPGSFDLQVGGIDPTGAATFTTRWRDAYKKP